MHISVHRSKKPKVLQTPKRMNVSEILHYLPEKSIVCTRMPVCKINPLKAELNPICHLLALLGAHLIFHISRIRVKLNSIKTFLNPPLYK